MTVRSGQGRRAKLPRRDGTSPNVDGRGGKQRKRTLVSTLFQGRLDAL